MKKKRGNNKSKARLGIKQHIKHKSKLTLLLVLKLAIATFILAVVGKFGYSKLLVMCGDVWAFVLSFAILCIVYLFLIVKVLNIMKFK